MANPGTTSSVKGHRRAQWEEEEEKKWQTRDIEKQKERKENRANEERKKEYRKPKVMKKI